MKHNVVIDLDVLLDTRISTINNIDFKLAIELLENGFCSRQTDDLTGVTTKLDNATYRAAYAARDVNTLKNARLTSYIFELADVVGQLARNIADDDSRVDEPCIVLNYYPYKELDDETIADIIYAIGSYTTEAIDIKAVYYEPEVLDLKFLKENDILTYITYDFKLWFETNFSVRKGKDSIISYPKFTIIAPKLMPDRNTFNNLDAQSKKLLQDKTPFEFMKLYWAPMFNVEFCPIELMSLIDTNILASD